jgi:hypothetical protein
VSASQIRPPRQSVGVYWRSPAQRCRRQRRRCDANLALYFPVMLRSALVMMAPTTPLDMIGLHIGGQSVPACPKNLVELTSNQFDGVEIDEVEIREISHFGAVPVNFETGALRWTPPALRLQRVRRVCFPPNASMRRERAFWRFVPSVVPVGKQHKICVAHRSKFGVQLPKWVMDGRSDSVTGMSEVTSTADVPRLGSPLRLGP